MLSSYSWNPKLSKNPWKSMKASCSWNPKLAKNPWKFMKSYHSWNLKLPKGPWKIHEIFSLMKFESNQKSMKSFHSCNPKLPKNPWHQKTYSPWLPWNKKSIEFMISKNPWHSKLPNFYQLSISLRIQSIQNLFGHFVFFKREVIRHSDRKAA